MIPDSVCPKCDTPIEQNDDGSWCPKCGDFHRHGDGADADTCKNCDRKMESNELGTWCPTCGDYFKKP